LSLWCASAGRRLGNDVIDRPARISSNSVGFSFNPWSGREHACPRVAARLARGIFAGNTGLGNSLDGPLIQPVGARTPSPGISAGGFGRGVFVAARPAIDGAFVRRPPPSLPPTYRGRGKSIISECVMDSEYREEDARFANALVAAI